MGVKRITDYLAAAALDGTELLEIAQLSLTVTRTAVTISAAAADNSYNDSANGFIAAGFAVGNRVNVAGFTGNVANNILVGIIGTLTTGKMTILPTEGDAITDDAAGESVTITKWESRRTTAEEVSELARSETMTASEALAAGSFGNIHLSGGVGQVRKADADDDTKPVDCYIRTAIGNGDPGLVTLPGGVIRGLTGLTPGSDYYLSTVGGGITDTAPSVDGSGNLIQRIGKALSATKMTFNPVIVGVLS